MRQAADRKEMQFPSSQVETALHERVLAADPIAPVDLFAQVTDPLISAIRHDLQCDAEIARDSAIDALFDYLHTPAAYKPDKGRLCTFLTQVGKHKAIDRIRARSAEARREQEFVALVELGQSAPNEEMERSAEALALWHQIEQVVQDGRDRKALALILDGERSTDALAEALGIHGLTQLERQREVKRHRDRLLKTLERLGARLHDERGS
jgi:RNA polymerase sigma-70 factor, ECF subfamily